MTERYIFDPSINHFTDTKTDKRYCEYNLDEVVDMLNKYEKENQQLKKENNDYNDAINEIADILREAYEQGVSNPYLKRIGKVKLEAR